MSETLIFDKLDSEAFQKNGIHVVETCSCSSESQSVGSYDVGFNEMKDHQWDRLSRSENIKRPQLLHYSLIDFLLSRQAKNCSTRTLEWYSYSLQRIENRFNEFGVFRPDQITRVTINAFLADLISKNLSSSYVHSYARVLKTLMGFLYAEGYIQTKVEFEMPILKNRRQRVYSENEIRKVLNASDSKRDKAFIMVMVDTGIRLGEVLALNWGDMDMNSGVIRIENGKGGKFRSVVIGVEARRALIKYRPEVDSSDDWPVFQTVQGRRFVESGLRSWLRRLSDQSGIHITPHALRRTFATMALKAGMDLIRLQQLMGHADLDTTRQYIHVLDIDLINAHKNHSPIEFILKGKN